MFHHMYRIPPSLPRSAGRTLRLLAPARYCLQVRLVEQWEFKYEAKMRRRTKTLDSKGFRSGCTEPYQGLAACQLARKVLGDSGIQRRMFDLAAKTVVPSPNTFWAPQRLVIDHEPRPCPWLQ